MAYSIKDPGTDRVIRELARVKGKPIIEAIREACEAELKRERLKVPLQDRIAALQAEIAALPKTGLVADKAFFDDLSGEF